MRSTTTNLRAFREHHGFTVETLAAIIDVPAPVLALMESGAIVHHRHRERLCMFFGEWLGRAVLDAPSITVMDALDIPR